MVHGDDYNIRVLVERRLQTNDDLITHHVLVLILHGRGYGCGHCGDLRESAGTCGPAGISAYFAEMRCVAP